MKTKKIKKILVANRGEIAVRVFRACHELDISTVAIYSQEDALSAFRTKADESYLIGKGHTPLGAYLDIREIIKLAKAKNVDAIHPGYGFLSENADFARACEKNGILFIGPTSQILAKMGDKLSAKEIADNCNVPTIPGTKTPLQSENEAAEKAQQYGYPVILKAAAGGGGRGMRRVNNEQELRNAFSLVQSEALKSFGNDDIFIEKYLIEPKHIEMQIIADKHGNVVHLFERDCSLQRRHQKVIEVAPATSISQATKHAIYDDSVKIAKAVNYINAGTVEFLVDKNGDHYFIEMNPRVQVEHTITEVITGIDIVQTQILIAEGHNLHETPIDIPPQAEITHSGVAIQCRVTTEDPANSFSPDYGKITVYRSSGGLGVRLDTGTAFTGAEISPYYDSLLVKVITHDRTLLGATRKAWRALNEMRIRGVKTNIPFLNNILGHEKFLAGDCTTTFIDDTASLYEMYEPQDRATKILNFIGHTVVNGKNLDQRPMGIAPIPQLPKSVKVDEKPQNLKKMLDEQGADAVKNFALNAKNLLLVDTTLRDAHQSLLATRVRTRDMLNIADYTSFALDKAFALEMWGGATFDVAYRFLHESPWERLALLREKIPNILFAMLLRGANAVGYTSYPDNLIQEFIKEAAQTGVDIFRVFDSLNWLPNMQLSIDEVLRQGKLCEGYICYTGDISDPTRDKYNLQYYVDIAKDLERRGVHILGIKDMSGLLKPYAAHKLVSTLKQEIGLPIHFHTHDTAGNGVASVLKAAEAGVDIADVAISSMSSLTSQPSFNAVITALQNTDRATGFDDQPLLPISDYWEHVRRFYGKFEEGLTSPATDIYRYEIPGGQYSNLKVQVESVGLGDRYQEVKEKYREVNQMLGDIIKVTPSSKMVGDFAIFMTQNELTAENITKNGKHLSYPDSVISYFEGMMGQPQGGFPERLQKLILKGKKAITSRPGEHLPPINFEKIQAEMQSFRANATMQDMISYCLYPKVMTDFFSHMQEYSDLSMLETPVFFNGLAAGESTVVEIADGKTLFIKLVSISEPDEDNNRSVMFELNGRSREVIIHDTGHGVVKAAFTVANADNSMEIGASIPGMVSKINVAVGDEVQANTVLAIIEAMKMETTVMSKVGGVIDEIHVKQNQPVKAGELIITMR